MRKIVLGIYVVSCVYVGDMMAVEPLWGTTLESKVDIIDNELSANDQGVNAKLDSIDDELSVHDAVVNATINTIDGKVATVSASVGALTSCGLTPLSSSDISGGKITISSAGTYCLTQDVTATFTITADYVKLDLKDRIVTGSIVIGADNVVVESGTVKPTAASGFPGVEISGVADRAEVRDLFIICFNQASPAAGLDGIQIDGAGAVSDCTVFAGNANGDGNDGGSAIVIGSSANDVVIDDCFLRGGNGGASTSATAGGDGGHGIDVVSGATLIDIYDCIVHQTGAGGANSSSGDGGNGGHGINIASGAVDVSIHNCVIRDTGAGGTAGVGANGAGGKAIFDSVATGASKSIIVGNLAYNIDNTTKFDLLATSSEYGIQISPFPPDGTQTNMNQWGNYFIT